MRHDGGGDGITNSSTIPMAAFNSTAAPSRDVRDMDIPPLTDVVLTQTVDR